MAEYHAATTGSDSNDGSLINPFRTIAKLLATLTAGDTGHIKPGHYNENTLTPTNIGTSGNEITLRGDWDGSIFGTAGYIVVDGISSNIVSTNVFAPSNNWDYWNIEGLVCVGASYSPLNLSPTTGATLNHLHITRCIGFGGTYGLYLSGTATNKWTVATAANALVIDQCYFHGSSYAFAVPPGGQTDYSSFLIKNTRLTCGVGPHLYISNLHSNSYVSFVNSEGLIPNVQLMSNAKVVMKSVRSIGCFISVHPASVVDATYMWGTATGSETAIGEYPFVPGVHRVMGWAGHLGVVTTPSSPTVSVDIFGRTRPGSNEDVGSEEYDSARLLSAPIGEIETSGGTAYSLPLKIFCKGVTGVEMDTIYPGKENAIGIKVFEDGVRRTDLTALTRCRVIFGGVEVDSATTSAAFTLAYDDADGNDVILLDFGELASTLPEGDWSATIIIYEATRPDGYVCAEGYPIRIKTPQTGTVLTS